MNRIIFIGPRGTDAGAWYIGTDGKIHHIPGWNPEQLSDVAHLLQGLREFSQVKAVGVAERAVSGVLEAVKKELGAWRIRAEA